jgi:NET1-associated nuclear protein 1 (U3 small nucleolar RNA-associated protein 17)
MLSPSGAFLVALAGQKAYVLPTAPDRMAEGFTKFVSPEILTCGAMHPREDWFVSGDAKGVVRMWFCLGELASGRPATNGGQDAPLLADDGASDKETAAGTAAGQQQKASSGAGIRTTPTTTLHWHSHAVASIAFTAAGTSILSGGEEAVLVAWSVANGAKTFVPRVGGPIASVVVRPPGHGREEEWWVGLANGGLRRLGGDGKGGRNVLGGWESAKIEPSPAPASGRPSPLAYHAPTQSLLLPAAHPSSVQLYSPAHQSSILELEVAPSNRVSRAADKEVEPVRVELAALGTAADQTGWLATAERREADEEEGAEASRTIKVWRWDDALRTYVLTTRLEAPHKTDVGSLAFSPVPVSLPGAAQPTLLLLSTSAADGVARLWREKRTRFKSGKVEGKRALPDFSPSSLATLPLALLLREAQPGACRLRLLQETLLFSRMTKHSSSTVLITSVDYPLLLFISDPPPRPTPSLCLSCRPLSTDADLHAPFFTTCASLGLAPHQRYAASVPLSSPSSPLFSQMITKLSIKLNSHNHPC